MWQNYFKGLLNTCQPDRQYIDKFSNVDIGNTLFTPIDIYTAIKELKSGKSCGLDGLSAEHYKYASDNLPVLLSLVFRCMIVHGYLPKKFMYTVIVPLVKNKKESITDQDNYRPIAITSVCSKISELLILHIYREYLCSKHNQFGFKNGHGTDIGVFALKSIIDYYISLSSFENSWKYVESLSNNLEKISKT